MSTKRAMVLSSSGTKRPDFTLISEDSRKFEKLFDSAMYFIHYEYQDKRLKVETMRYAKNNKINIKPLEKLDNYYFSVIGKPCVILNNGGDVPPEWKAHVDTEIDRLTVVANKMIPDVSVECKNKKAPTVQDYVQERARNIAGILEGLVDDYTKNPSSFKKRSPNPLEILRNEGTKPAHARIIIKMITPCVEEFYTLVSGTDDDLVKAYGSLTKAQRKYILSLYESFIEASQSIIRESGTTRKKKPVPAIKLVSKLKYLKEYTPLSLSSVPAVDVIGAKVLWIYNTKTRKLGKYVAKDAAGLSVRGTTIQNYSEIASVEKTLRKPEEMIAAFNKAKPSALKTFLENISTVDIKLKGRVNEHCILLKVQ